MGEMQCTTQRDQVVTHESSMRRRQPASVLGVMGGMGSPGRVDRDGARGGDGGVGGGVVGVALGEEVHGEWGDVECRWAMIDRYKDSEGDGWARVVGDDSPNGRWHAWHTGPSSDQEQNTPKCVIMNISPEGPRPVINRVGPLRRLSGKWALLVA